jgi:mono/diheme cytochrome c family protein
MYRHILVAALLPTAFAQTGVELFEKTVRPILRTNCLACHSEKNLSSGLSLETRESILKGGNRGPVLPSALLDAIRQTGDLKMPPGRKLKDEQIAAIEQWVAAGVPMPEALLQSRRPGAGHWAFQPPVRAKLPAAGDGWARSPIDRFVAAKLSEAKLAPSAEAPRAVLLRRVSLDLTGLPPTPAEVEEFLRDQRPDAYERAVDRLLASPHYGERWARDWLDIARYADTDGYTIDAPRDIWKYRDWVIAALNADMPFDRYVVEQFAGDLLPNPTVDQLIATGFHRNTPSNFEGGIDFEQYRVEAVADRVATTGAAFMGLTLGCARCHDHKYDPITQREFYQLFAFFNNVDEVDKEADRKDFNKPFLELGTEAEKAAFATWQQEIRDKEEKIQKFAEALGSKAEGDPMLAEMRKEASRLNRAKPKLTRTFIMKELPAPRESYIHLGGDFLRKGVTVKPAVPAIFPQPESPNPNRLDFARWLVDRRNPLTARVTVNRIWQRYFGKGLVDTENDFGTQGEKPSHPELLDWMALDFMESGWSLKKLHRSIVLSAVYRQSSNDRADAAAVDPGNRLLARQARLRLDAEMIRDSALVAAGLFNPAVGGPSVYPPLPAGANSVTQVKREWPTAAGPDRYRRGIYTFFQRSAPHPGLVVFDAPDGGATCTRRVRSNNALQALTLLNDEAYVEFAQAFAKRARAEAAADGARLDRMFLLAMARPAAAGESARLTRFLKARRDASGEEAAWLAVARVVLNLDEFMTRE